MSHEQREFHDIFCLWGFGHLHHGQALWYCECLPANWPDDPWWWEESSMHHSKCHPMAHAIQETFVRQGILEFYLYNLIRGFAPGFWYWRNFWLCIITWNSNPAPSCQAWRNSSSWASRSTGYASAISQKRTLRHQRISPLKRWYLLVFLKKLFFFEDIFGQVSPLKIPSLQELHSLAGNATVLDHMFTKWFECGFNS